MLAGATRGVSASLGVAVNALTSSSSTWLVVLGGHLRASSASQAGDVASRPTRHSPPRQPIDVVAGPDHPTIKWNQTAAQARTQRLAGTGTFTRSFDHDHLFADVVASIVQPRHTRARSHSCIGREMLGLIDPSVRDVASSICRDAVCTRSRV